MTGFWLAAGAMAAMQADGRAPGAPAAAQTGGAVDPRPDLRAELERARTEIATQRRQLEAQEARLQALEERMRGGTTAVAAAPAPRVGLQGASQGALQGPSQGAPAVGLPPPAAIAQASSAGAPGDPATIQQATIQGPVGQRPADRERPPEVAVLGSEGSIVTRRGQLTAELQLDYARADRNRALFRGIEIVESVLVGEFNINESRQDIFTASLASRYGLTDRLELGVRLPVVHRSDNSVLVPVQGSTNNDPARELDSSAKGTGIGDLEVSARYQIATARGGLPFLVGNLQVVAPTGSNPFNVPRIGGEATRAATGAGFWGISPSVTAILPTDPAVLFGTIGYTHNFGRDVNTVIDPVRITYVKPGDALSFSAGIGVALNDRTSMNLGYAHTWAFGTLTRTELANPGPNGPVSTEATSRDLQIGRLLFGVTYRATERASVNWSVEIGATEDSPDVRTVLRLPFLLLSPS